MSRDLLKKASEVEVIGQDHTVQTVAKAYCISHVTLNRYFKAEMSSEKGSQELPKSRATLQTVQRSRRRN